MSDASLRARCAAVHAFADGELADVEHDELCDHLAACAGCQAELLELVQLDAVAVEVGRAEGRRVRRLARGSLGIALFALAAAAVALLVLRRQPAAERAAGEDGDVVLALAARRSIEGRPAHPAADRHRPFDVARAAGAGGESIPLATLAELERRGDLEGVAAALLLMGEPRRAAIYLDRAPRTAATQSDRALVLLADGRHEEALAAVEVALLERPDHPPARWNRALVVRDLGLAALAAEAFDQIAAVGEPGWADEARRRAAALRAEISVREAAWQVVERGGAALVATGAGLAIDDARRVPGLARLYLYDAVRSAPTRARVLALAPLAAALDELHGGRTLTSYVATTARADFARRAPHAHAYAALIAGAPPPTAEATRWLAALRRDRQPDILLGALLHVGPVRGRVAVAALAEYRALAHRTGDPWFDLLAVEQAARARADAGDPLGAERELVAGLARCGAGGDGPDHRCARLERTAAELALALHRVSDARRHAAGGWRRARRAGDVAAELALLPVFAEVAQLHDDVGDGAVALVRAYLGESELRARATSLADRCGFRAYARESLAMLRVHQGALADARHEMRLARHDDECGEPSLGLHGAFVLAHVLRAPGAPASAPRDAIQIARVRSALAALRADPARPPGERAFADHVEGRLLIERDRSTARSLLHRAIAAAASRPAWDVDARKAAAYSTSVLALDAGAHHEWALALDTLAAAVGIPTPSRCAVGVATEDGSFLAVVRGPDGTTRGHFASPVSLPPPAPAPAPDHSMVIPPLLLAPLSTCDTVDVLARAPLHGIASLLPRQVAWRYRSTPSHRSPAAPSTAPASAPARRLVVAAVAPPPSLGLPPLSAPPHDPAAVELRGPQATPARFLAAAAAATEIEIHAHGLVSLGVADASYLALSPDSDGRHAVTAADLRRIHLDRAPVVLLAACHGAEAARFFHQPWSLAAAFVAAGARAVIASPAPIGDAAAVAVFAALRVRLAAGASAAVALRDLRLTWPDAADRAWIGRLVVFE